MKKKESSLKTSIGGQAVLEGVMMRGKKSVATAVRDGDGIIRVESGRIAQNKNRLLKLPIIRGAVNFFNSMVFGTKTLIRSADVYGEEEPTKFEKWISEKFKINLTDVAVFLGVFLGLALSIFLFFFLPQKIAEWMPFLKIGNIWYYLFEGLIRIAIFILYIFLSSLLKDIKRTYMYHGAEHKTISCYEKGLPLTVENVRNCKRVHDRCGTTFMFIVMVISIIIFALCNYLLLYFGFDITFAGIKGRLLRFAIKLLLLPLVAGVSYEVLKLLAKTDSVLVYPFKLPGLLLQRITTREPDDKMIEVAITAFNIVLAMDEDDSIPCVKFITPEKCKDLVARIKAEFVEHNIDESDAEWIVSIVSGIKRSELNSEKLISTSKIDRITKIKEERLTGKPLSYVLGNSDFYGYTVKVNDSVLIPRPETEELVDKVKNEINSDYKVLDLCTGSGVIGISLKLMTNAEVTASDVSASALSVAKENAKNLGALINFIQSDMFENIEDKFDVIVSNPPYIPSGDIEKLDREVKNFEPVLALDGGVDGLDFYRIIAKHAKERLFDGGVIYLECGINQQDDIRKIFSDYTLVEEFKDINGIVRIIKVSL